VDLPTLSEPSTLPSQRDWHTALSPSEIDSQQRQTTKPKKQLNETSHALRDTVNSSPHHDVPQTLVTQQCAQACCRYAAKIYPAK